MCHDRGLSSCYPPMLLTVAALPISGPTHCAAAASGRPSMSPQRLVIHSI
jgi:hypothetical protein